MIEWIGSSMYGCHGVWVGTGYPCVNMHMIYYAFHCSAHDTQQYFLDQRHVPLDIHLPIRNGKAGCWLAIPLRATNVDFPRRIDPLNKFLVRGGINRTEENDVVDTSNAVLLHLGERRRGLRE